MSPAGNGGDEQGDHRPTDKQLWQIERGRIHANARTRRESDCYVCGRRCPATEYPKKYAGAGGVLAGPFCCSDCFWRFFNDDYTDGVAV